MRKVKLGSTGIMATHVSLGLLPLQRVDMDEAARILERAYGAGINFYDTARGYSDSEEKLGNALSSVRDKIYIATKSGAQSGEGLRRELETSLSNLKTDYVDVLQLHNPAFCPIPGGVDGIYDAALQAKAEGLVRHIGITNHRKHVADEAVASGLYELLQFPLSYLSSESELELARNCAAADMGFVAMKPLAGGVLTNAKAVYSFFETVPHVVPIYGVQRMEELEEFLGFVDNPPALAEVREVMEKDIAELRGSFCRNCGYCLPCPEGIRVDHVCRSYYNLRRLPQQNLLTPEWRQMMEDTKKCKKCGACSKRCPYELDPPSRFEFMYDDYMKHYEKTGG